MDSDFENFNDIGDGRLTYVALVQLQLRNAVVAGVVVLAGQDYSILVRLFAENALFTRLFLLSLTVFCVPPALVRQVRAQLELVLVLQLPLHALLPLL